MTPYDTFTKLKEGLDQGAHLEDVASTEEHLVLMLDGPGADRMLLDATAIRRLVGSGLLDRLVDSYEAASDGDRRRLVA